MIAEITKNDLSLVENNVLNKNQLQQILRKTPQKYVKQRPAKGGGKWNYVSVSYIQKVLNIMFGWDWDFEIVDEKIMIEAKEVVVKGRLTCRIGDRTITKMQYGNKDIIFRKGTNEPLSIGNDMKAAASDALKKCATSIGIAADVYAPDDFNEVKIVEEDEETLRVKGHLRSATDELTIEAIISSLGDKYEKYKDIVEARRKELKDV